MEVYEKEIESFGAKGRAVVVEPDVPWKLIAWERAQYIPCWAYRDVWYTSEWVETFSVDDGVQNFEPMHDKKCTYSRISSAKKERTHVDLKWEYALTNTKGRVFHGNGRAVENYRIYPEGYAERTITAWPGDKDNYGGRPYVWEVAETIMINDIGVPVTESISETPATFFNLKGDSYTHRWDPSRYDPQRFPLITPLCRFAPEIADWEFMIIRINLRNRPAPFVVIPHVQKLFPHAPCGECGKEHPGYHVWPDYPLWSHWPVYDQTDFTGSILARKEDVYKRSTHTTIVSIGAWYGQIHEWYTPKVHFPDWELKPGTTWNVLMGMTQNDNDWLIKLVKKWKEKLG